MQYADAQICFNSLPRYYQDRGYWIIYHVLLNLLKLRKKRFKKTVGDFLQRV